MLDLFVEVTALFPRPAAFWRLLAFREVLMVDRAGFTFSESKRPVANIPR